jgi:hypothetical protein
VLLRAEDPAPSVIGETNSQAAVPPTPSVETPSAPVTEAPVSSARPLGTNMMVLTPAAMPPPPPDLPSPVQEVVKLAQTTLGEGVQLDFIGSIATPYRLSADQVVYLSDLGLTSKVIQALLQHSMAADQLADSPSTSRTFPPAPVPSLQYAQQPSPYSASSAADGLPLAGEAKDLMTNYPASPYPGGDPAGGSVPSVTYDVPPPAAGPAPPAIAADPNAYEAFYPSLSPYGRWVYLDETGWVWQPTVASIHDDWQPYSDNGYWVWSDYGWYWNSCYTWGWAPFHYGRWFRAAHRGWCWVPDRTWGPAWVTWRVCDTHCGWAPLPPGSIWRPGYGFTYYGRHVGVGFDFGIGYSSFTYVHWNHFTGPRPWEHRVQHGDLEALHGQSHVINDIHGHSISVNGRNTSVVINNGPGLAAAQQHASAQIPKVNLANASAPSVNPAAGIRTGAAGATIQTYRPNLNSVAATASPAGMAQQPGAPTSPTAMVRQEANPRLATARPYLAPS